MKVATNEFTVNEKNKELFKRLFELQFELMNYRKTLNRYDQEFQSELETLLMKIEIIMNRILTDS